MSREALKFTNLDAFLSVMEQQGFGQQAKAILYEGDTLPYCSAYFIPTELLPAGFNQDQFCRFGGVITQIQDIHYIGTEQFYTDFMIYPLSRTGYVEVDGVNPVTFAPKQSEQDQDWKHMIYVINLEDGGGKEFYLTTAGTLISLAISSPEEPQEFKSYKLAAKKISQVRENYPATCQIYALDQDEFKDRRKLLQSPPPGDPPVTDND